MTTICATTKGLSRHNFPGKRKSRKEGDRALGGGESPATALI